MECLPQGEQSLLRAPDYLDAESENECCEQTQCAEVRYAENDGRRQEKREVDDGFKQRPLPPVDNDGDEKQERYTDRAGNAKQSVPWQKQTGRERTRQQRRDEQLFIRRW